MCRLLSLLFAFVPTITFAGLPFEVSLEDMAKQADHILVGRVVGVDMVNDQVSLIIANSPRLE